ncbi:hypothetical protein SynPROS91_00995 [Synechococcus sp. PROS-9-1]|nr:hypothetical protein SynPROS91_00995 [Synechococcus sp. PROS-9-1]
MLIVKPFSFVLPRVLQRLSVQWQAIHRLALSTCTPDG